MHQSLSSLHNYLAILHSHFYRCGSLFLLLSTYELHHTTPTQTNTLQLLNAACFLRERWLGSTLLLSNVVDPR